MCAVGGPVWLLGDRANPTASRVLVDAPLMSDTESEQGENGSEEEVLWKYGTESTDKTVQNITIDAACQKYGAGVFRGSR